MKTWYLLVFALQLALYSCTMNNKDDIQEIIPSLDEVSGVWVSADTADMEPSLRNFRGQALLNRDMTSLSWFASAPYSGGYHTGVLRIDGHVPKASMFRWFPHQAIRKGELNDWKLYSTVKMIPDQDAVMWQVRIENDSTVARELNLTLDLIGFISKYGGDWQWWYPYPKLEGATTIRDDEVENIRKHIGCLQNTSQEKVVELIDGKPTSTDKLASWPSDEDILEAEKYRAERKSEWVVISDQETDAVTVFGAVQQADRVDVRNSGGTAHWKRRVEPGESFTISYLMGYGDREDKLLADMEHRKEGFDSIFQGVEGIWEERWQALFDPGSDLLSGCFPVLETDDELAKKVYYTGPLTMLYLMHTNLPEHKKVFLTGGPRWGASITFFWDITEWSSLWAVVDPKMMKEHLSAWIYIDPSKHYGKDNYGGEGVGNGYSANYWALFQMIRSYVTTTRDFDFLDQVIDEKSVMEHLESYAMNWKKLAPFGKPGYDDERYQLADFGDDEWNLLECVPTYKHIVPSFNAGYIWMMRETASLLELDGNSSRADSLRSQANEMIDRLLQLYAGEGVWNSLYPGGEMIEVRHCLDFMFLGRYIPDDIPVEIKEKMIEFLYEELITDRWMRAQSLKDVAAERSDRADHGPMGAFDGWPAGTMDALAQMGYPERALDFYHAIEPVTYEGCWSQAHELWGENKLKKNSRVRIAQRGWHNRESSGGISISQVMLKDFFGFYPGAAGSPVKNSGAFGFSGKLHHVLYGGEYYTLITENGKVIMKKEK
ncbi:MAG: hypothetical protein GY790_07175 [Bacteroidetes bacterium]|nr:hypothetical protein [Bacteroidota bacterium]